ncbi:Neuronal acetylcholine receptor subunit alpha-10 [Holothuria leucospilota]|uniref:Neuronal acetylcholine receptor subunit alpha-10 n=1 Tax=Holothuria leucospilota TaxID=206669 RepID=A0A9Q1B9V0_HOLLE|nr:Neuronal acetylcholine receptor subunit alpha-10 [Holothuria leucospilota]
METDYVKLFSNGTIYWYTLAMTTSYCRVNVKHFPFDKQKCVLTFTTWLYQSTERSYQKSNKVKIFFDLQQAFYIIDDIIKNEMYKNYEVSSGLWVWDITDLHAGNNSYYCSTCNNQEQSYITYTVEMTRTEHVWHFLIYLLPCMVLSTMLILIVELTRRYDVDAPNFGLTCILTLFVFLTFLFTQLPATGPPIMGFYIVVLIVEAVSATVYVTFRKAPRSCTKDDHIALADRKRDNKTLTEDTEDEKSKTTVTRMKTGWMGWIDKWIIRWWCFTGINMVFVIIFFPVIGFGK